MKMKTCECCGQGIPDVSGVAFDPDTNTVRRGALSVRLTPSQYQILLYIYQTAASGREAQRESVMDFLYQLRPGDEPGERIVDTFLCKMRPKISPLGIFIKGTWGSSFKLTVMPLEKLALAA